MYYCTSSLDCTPPRNTCPQLVVWKKLYGFFSSKKHFNQPQIFVPTNNLENHSFFLVVRIHTVRPPTTTIKLYKFTQKITLGNAPSLFPFPLLLKALSEISQSLLLIVSCKIPNAFSYNSKMTFHLPSVFSPSPSLNIKAKI